MVLLLLVALVQPAAITRRAMGTWGFRSFAARLPPSPCVLPGPERQRHAAERREALRTSAVRYGVGHVRHRLASLADRARRDHLVAERVDRDQAIAVLQSGINPGPIPGWPDPMRQRADRNGRDLDKGVRAEHFHLVEPTDRDIRERAVGIVNDVDVVGNRSGVERFEHRERRTGIKHLGLARILQREPDLLAIRRRRGIGAEGACLRDMPDNLVIGDADDDGLRREGGADIAVFPIGREDRHARTVGHDDTGLLYVGGWVDDGDIVLATDGYPDLLAVWREERLMRRAPDVMDVFYGIGARVEERHGIRVDGAD